MDNVLKLVFVFLLSFSRLVFADSYSAVLDPLYQSTNNSSLHATTIAGVCAAMSVYYAPTSIIQSGLGCINVANPSNLLMVLDLSTRSCPYGGSLSGTSCINVPSCVAPSIRNSSGVCFVPIICKPPEIDNGFGVCGLKECLAGTVRNGSTGQCQTPPTCGAAETYDNASNTCKLMQLACPNHSHASTANDQCLTDPPNGCPVGMHDDGTWTCVANDGVACNSNQVHGYIFGIPQCINKTNVDEFAKQAAEVAATKAASAVRAAASQAAADAANAAAAADPTNATKAAAASAANSTAATDATNAKNSNQAAIDAQNAENTAALKSMADQMQQNALQDKTDRINGFGVVPGAEAITTQSLTMSTVSGNSVSGSCPAPNVISTSHGSISISYQPICDFASMASPIVITLAWLSAGLIVFGSIKE